MNVKLLHACIALAIALVAVFVRCLPWEHIFTDAGVILPGVDPYYHLWHARLLAENFPSIVMTDPFLAYPAGAHMPWPPVFDGLLAIPILLGAGEQALLTWCAMLPPALGGLSCYLTYRLGRRVLTPVAGLIAAGLVALLHGHVSITYLGRADHHAIVAPLCLATYLALLAALRATDRKKAMVWGASCGVLATLSVGAWPITAPLYFLPVPLSLLLLRLAPDWRSRRVAALCTVATAGIGATAMVAFTSDLSALPYSLWINSWFTIILYWLAAAVVAAAYLGRWPLIQIFVTAALAPLLVWLAAPGLLEPLSRSLSVAAGQDQSLLMVVESSSLFNLDGFFSFSPLVWRYTYLAFLLPIILAAYLIGRIREGLANPDRVLMGSFGLIGVGLLALQSRFGEYAAPAVGLLLAWFLVVSWQRVHKWSLSDAHRWRRVGWTALLGLVFALALSPLLTSLLSFSQIDPTGNRKSLNAFALDFAKQTPEPEISAGRPSYGVLASWGDSYVLLARARRAIVASAFGEKNIYENTRKAWRRLLSSDEAAAVTDLEQLSVRYLVVTSILTNANRLARMTGIQEPYVEVRTQVDGDRTIQAYRPLPAFINSLHARMFIADGSDRRVGGNHYKGLSRLRLVLDASELKDFFGMRLPRFRAFELVPGATITGQASPVQPISLRLELRTNSGRRLTYQRRTRADDVGRFAIRVPYPSEAYRGGVEPVGDYRIKRGDQILRIHVSEAQIQAGAEITLPLEPADPN
jgi:asparagine N-glycosylation enzyme membrane subunit Stt3